MVYTFIFTFYRIRASLFLFLPTLHGTPKPKYLCNTFYKINNFTIIVKSILKCELIINSYFMRGFLHCGLNCYMHVFYLEPKIMIICLFQSSHCVKYALCKICYTGLHFQESCSAYTTYNNNQESKDIVMHFCKSK